MSEELSDSQKLWNEIGKIYDQHQGKTLTSEGALAAVTGLKGQFSETVLTQGPYHYYVSHFTAVCVDDAVNAIQQRWENKDMNGRDAAEAIYAIAQDLPEGSQLRLTPMDKIKGILTNKTYDLSPSNINPDFTLFEAARSVAAVERLYFTKQCGAMQMAYPKIEALLLEANRLGQEQPDIIADELEEIATAFLPKYADSPGQAVRDINPVYAQAMQHVKQLRASQPNIYNDTIFPVYPGGFGAPGADALAVRSTDAPSKRDPEDQPVATIS